MSTRLSEAASYGYVTILISKSPSIDMLTDIIERGEAIDISTAVTKGVLPTEYLKLSRYEDIDSVDSAIYTFYLELIRELSRYLPIPYTKYLEVFVEAYDIDIISSLGEQGKKIPKYMFSRLGSATGLSTEGKKGLPVSDYSVCFKLKSVIECTYRIYLKRVTNVLRSLHTPSLSSIAVDIRKSTDLLYLFVLTRLYSHVMNAKRLSIDIEYTDVATFLQKYGTPRNVMEVFSKIATKIESEFNKSPSLALIYEARHINVEAKNVLMYSPTLLDRLTYLLIEKFYESKLVRYIAMKKYRW